MNRRTNTSIQMIADFDGDISTIFNKHTDDELPMLITRNLVVFPGVLTPIIIGRKQSLELINAIKGNEEKLFAVFAQRDASIEMPGEQDIFEQGVFARLVRVIDMPGPGENITAIVQGLGRCTRKDITKTRPYYMGHAVLSPEELPAKGDKEFKTAHEDLLINVKNFVNMNEDIPDEMLFALKNIHNEVLSVNYICMTLTFSIEDKESLLNTSSIKDRVMLALKLLYREEQLQRIKQDIRMKTREDLDEQQREYFLQQQIKNIKEELGNGEGSPERKELLEQGMMKKWNKATLKYFMKELDKLDTLNPQSPDYSQQLNYLRTLVNLPWNEYTTDNLDLKRAQRILDHDHYGMEKVKERILEYMAVLKLRGDLKSPIICLYGPPGVGKTSLGKSIASAMKRKYVRMSLGGLHDESEIRGHRRTYIGAMPGRIIKNIQKAGSSNPVFILDEIDKVTQNTINGDPSSALLEVLDPEQNNAFHDNYLDVDYDLSKVLFIATANDLNTIPRPLLDRMEIIEVSGYITEEKIEIAKRHLIPRELENTGLDNLQKDAPEAEVETETMDMFGTPVTVEKPKKKKAKTEKLQFNKAAIEKIIEHYTRESGVRQLEKQINKALRKMALKKAIDGELPYEKITPTQLQPRHLPGQRLCRRGDRPGVDKRGRRDPVHRDLAEQRQGRQAHAHGQPGRRDERVGRHCSRICESTHRDVRCRLPHLRPLEHPHPCARGSHTQGRPVGRHNHRHIHRLGAHTAQGAQEHSHDRRDNAPWQGAPRGWYKGKDSCSQACRHYRHRDVSGQQERH